MLYPVQGKHPKKHTIPRQMLNQMKTFSTKFNLTFFLWRNLCKVKAGSKNTSVDPHNDPINPVTILISIGKSPTVILRAETIALIRWYETAVSFSIPTIFLMAVLAGNKTKRKREFSFKKFQVEKLPCTSSRGRIFSHDQCDQIWRNFTAFATNWEIFGHIFKVHFVFGKVVKPLWDNLYDFG